MIRYVTEFYLLEELQWALINGHILLRKDAIWILANMVTSQEGVQLILNRCENICVNMMLELKKKDLKMKSESMFFFANMLSNLGSHPHQVKTLVGMNLLGVIHDELYDGNPDNALAIIFGLECLSSVFRILEDEKLNFLSIYGADFVQ